jgi:stage IV sporulation protein FB
MSWRDREFDDGYDPAEGDGEWQQLRPSFDNPITWSFPIGRLLRTRFRVHAVLPIFIVVELARSLTSAASAGPAIVAVEVTCLVLIVVAHELGHCIACRRTGGEADDVLLWPLGGLAFCRPPIRWHAYFITAAGGPLVNVLIFLITGGALLALTGSWLGGVVPHLFEIDLPTLTDGRQPYWLVALFLLHRVNVIVLLLNLLPMFPLDGGRIAQSLLWARLDYERATRAAAYAGMVIAIALVLVAAVLTLASWILIGVAAVGGLSSWWMLRQVQFTQSFLGRLDAGESNAPTFATNGTGEADPAEEQDAEGAATDAREVDRILAKIGQSGLSSLSRRERRLLRQATARRRRGGG